MVTYKNKQSLLSAFILTALLLCLLAGCGKMDKVTITSLDQLGEPGTKIGVGSDMLE